MHFLTPKPPKMTGFWPKKGPKTAQKGQKWSKIAQKGPKKASKWGQNDTKTTPKWCQNDAKMIPKWPRNDPGSTQKMVQNHPKMTLFWSHNSPKMALRTPSQQLSLGYVAMGHGKVLKWSTGLQKSVQKEGGRVRKGGPEKLVQKPGRHVQ